MKTICCVCNETIIDGDGDISHGYCDSCLIVTKLMITLPSDQGRAVYELQRKLSILSKREGGE